MSRNFDSRNLRINMKVLLLKVENVPVGISIIMKDCPPISDKSGLTHLNEKRNRYFGTNYNNSLSRMEITVFIIS